jgi:hypothetical protein
MKKLFFFGVLVVMIYNIIGCTRQSSGPPPVPSIYLEDDSLTGIFNYTGIVSDSVQIIDSSLPPSLSGYQYPSGYIITVKKSVHQVSGQIRIKRQKTDTYIFDLTCPINDGYDSVSLVSGIKFQTDTTNYVNFIPGTVISDTIVRGYYLNNVLNISNFNHGPMDKLGGYIKLFKGYGSFENEKWEIDYQTSGVYTERIYANPYPSFQFLYGYHTYHLTCVKQH